MSQRRTALVLRHVAFEDLGTWEPVLRERGYDIRYVDVPDLADPAVLVDEDADLLVVLGGPIGVDQLREYPFLTPELELLRLRLAIGLPTLGVCLGAQLIATALGATVSPGSAVEIGFAPIEVAPGEAAPDEAASAPNVLAPLQDVPVFHWHGDQFALPAGATALASTPVCARQAFAVGTSVLAVQFHPEFDASRVERWLVGHAHELFTRGIDPVGLRADAQRHGDRLRIASTAVLNAWLDGVDGAGG